MKKKPKAEKVLIETEILRFAQNDMRGPDAKKEGLQNPLVGQGFSLA